ncbi:hypothetical protein GEMRC1_010183 [Eukaryota sp. GEM-RC1]
MVRNEVSTINLDSNSIGNEGAIAIAEALKVNSSLSTINLYSNSIGNEGAIAIAEALKVNSSLSTINLNNNSIGNEGAIAIAEALKVNSSLSTIVAKYKIQYFFVFCIFSVLCFVFFSGQVYLYFLYLFISPKIPLIDEND